jgi:hypothetical protein
VGESLDITAVKSFIVQAQGILFYNWDEHIHLAKVLVFTLENIGVSTHIEATYVQFPRAFLKRLKNASFNLIRNIGT